MSHLKKFSIGLFSACMVIFGSFSVFADEFDDKIAEQRSKLQQIEASKLSQSTQLSTLLKEQNDVVQQMATVQTQIEQTQAEMTVLINDIHDLEELIAKRDKRIREQARQLQTIDGAGNILEAIFSSESIIEAIAKVHAMTQITSHSLDILQQQKADKDLLLVKQVDIEKKSQEQQANIAELSTLKQTLATNVTEAQLALVELNLNQAKTQEEIDGLQQQKVEAERLKQEAAARIAAQQAAARQAAESARLQQIAQASANANTSQPASIASLRSSSSSSNISVPAPVSPNRSGAFAYPIGGNVKITSWFGEARTIGSYSDIHKGVDFVNGNPRAPILAASSGTVIFSGTSSGGGLTVVLKHANGLYTYYMHLSSLAVSVGQSVSQGQTLGIIGSTGISTGIHLHFAVSTSLWSGYQNPMNYLN